MAAKYNYRIYIFTGIIIILAIVSIFYRYINEEKLWNKAKELNDSYSYNEYIEKYPSGKYFKFALAKYDSIFWVKTVNTKSFEAYQYYINHNIKGVHILTAKKIIKKLYELPVLDSWRIDKHNFIFFPNHEKFLIATTYSKDNYDVQIKIFQCEFDRINTNENIWRLIGKSEEVGAFRAESTYILKTNLNSLVLSSFNLGGAHGISNYFITRLDSIGNLQIETHSNALAEVKISESSIITTEDFKRIEYFMSNQDIDYKIIERSEMAPSNSVKLYFKYSNGRIVASNSEYININVGQTIAFIPDGTEGGIKSDFNSGHIQIYSDIPPCYGNEVEYGNYITMDKCGDFKFLLTSYGAATMYSDGTYYPTFNVNVSKIENKPTSSTQAKNEQNTQSGQRTIYQRSNRDYFVSESAVHEFLSRHSFKSDDGSRLSYSPGSLMLSYSGGRMTFINIEIRIVNKDEAVVSAMEVSSGRTLRIYLNAAYGSIVDMNDNSTSFQAQN